MFKEQNCIYNEKSRCFIEINFISILDMNTFLYSEPLIHVTTKVTQVTHTGPWNDNYCPLVQINILLTIITAMLYSHAKANEPNCMLDLYTIMRYWLKFIENSNVQFGSLALAWEYNMAVIIVSSILICTKGQ